MNYTTPRLLRVACALVLAAGCRAPRTAPAAQTLDARLPPRTDAIYRAVVERFEPRHAMDVVTFMDQFWRVAGNEGFTRSQEDLRDRLVDGGFAFAAATAPATGADTTRARVWFEEFENAGRGWDHTRGSVTILAGHGQPDDVVLSRERHRVALCINSFSTPPGGLVAPLVDVGRGVEPADYEIQDVKGAVVLGDGPIGRLWEQAVARRGAAGVISTALPAYISPDPPGAPATPRDQWEILQWGSIPYDEARGAFGFKASPRAAARLRSRLAAGAVSVRIDIQSTFSSAPNRSLLAEIPGRSRPDERIVMVAHVQEPGANDDASGCGTLVELARALNAAIRGGRVAPPERTLTFMWVDEVRGSRQWLKDHPDRAKGVQYMFSLDMTGEDTTKTGGTFQIEKSPDPSAVWLRPSDPHTEWGRSEVKAESLRGSLLNDLHYAVCLRRARDAGWVVRTNPYEGGSDHTAFGDAGIPSVLDWHFTDRYYHTNLDRPDKTSAPEMMHVGVAIATTAMLLASADERDAIAVAGLIAAAGEARLALESRQARELIARAPDRAAAEATERAVFAAWQKWYVEALESVLRLPAHPAGPELQAVVREAIGRVRAY